MKTITITKDEYKRAVAEAVLDITEENNSANYAKTAFVKIMVSVKLAATLEAKLFGEDDDE